MPSGTSLPCTNYREACLKAWKTTKAESPLMSGAVNGLRSISMISRNYETPQQVSFTFPGYASADRKADQVFSGRVRRQAMEKSVFARFARHFEIMYGDRWATFMGGRLDRLLSQSIAARWSSHGWR